MDQREDSGSSRGAPIAIFGLLVVVLLWWWWTDDSVTPPADASTHVEERQQEQHEPDVLPVKREVADVDEPELPAEPEPDDADLDHPYEFRMLVTLQTPFGLPVDGANVYLAPEFSGFSMWPEPTDGRGNVTVRWRGRQRAMSIHVAVMAWGVLQPIRRVTVDADMDARVAVAVRGREQTLRELTRLAESKESQEENARLKVTRERHKNRKRPRMDALDILCGRTMVMFRPFYCMECHEPGRVSSYRAISRSSTMQPGLHPVANFQDLTTRGLSNSEVKKRKKELAERLRAKHFEELRRKSKYRGELQGTVSTANGKPAVGVPVAWIGPQGTLEKVTYSDHKGRYYLRDLPGGNMQFVVGGGPLGRAESLLQVAPVDTTMWNPKLSYKQAIRGKVLDEKGKPLARWPIEIVRDADGWATLAVTDRDGEFSAYGVPGTAQCVVWPREATASFPVIYGKEAMVDASVLRLELDDDRPIRGRLRVSVELPPHYDQSRVNVRVVQVETGRVAEMTPSGFGSEFVAEPLAPGWYELQIGAAGLGWTERRVFVDGRGLWDVGRVHIGTPGRVRILPLPGAPDVLQMQYAFYRRTEATDILVDPTRNQNVFQLGPGPHVFVWKSATGLRAREINVVSGSEVELRIWPE